MSTSGLFVAPKFGKYFFAYSGLSEGSSPARVELQLKTNTADWTKVGHAYGGTGHQTLNRCKPRLILLKAIRSD
jgi:hypothetical protein